ncbi:MAG: class I SAM-dependent methyltransferase [Vicinamibacterales bacterium]
MIDAWLRDLEARHFANLRFSEVTRALRALSSAYVERRESALADHKALDGAGKRAAFALYYGPIHFELIRAIAERLIGNPKGLPPQERGVPPPNKAGLVVDLGCGTGVAGAAIATMTTPPSRVIGIDTHPWTLDEARFTYRALGLNAEVRRGFAGRTRIPEHATFVVGAFVVNELKPAERDDLLRELKAAVARGTAVLIVEPISLRISPWWEEWAAAFLRMGGRADEWKIRADLPPIVKRLAKASSLRPDSLTARSLYAEKARSG